MKNSALVVLAAGMGSRFGGLKQIAPAGRSGETVLPASSEWFGVACRDDRVGVENALVSLVAKGAYPSRLWN